MILHGNQRGGARNLALHLLKAENEHVELHELRGFVSDDLASALNEVYAVSRGTRARQFLYSLSLNPPPEAKVSTATFQDAIERIERLERFAGERSESLSQEIAQIRAWGEIPPEPAPARERSRKRHLGDVHPALER